MRKSFNKIILEYANNNKDKKSEIAILKKKISFNKKKPFNISIR